MSIKFLSQEQAKILSNKTARKILEILDKKKSTSQLAKELDLPLTTVDYNISQLKKAGLIKSGYYKWSKRGNKMKLYEQAGEILIFAPEDKQKDILDALNKFTAPAVLCLSAISGFIVQKLLYRKPIMAMSQVFSEESSRSDAVMMGSEKVAASVMDTAVNTASISSQSEPQLWFWFMLSAGLVMLFLYLFKLRKNS